MPHTYNTNYFIAGDKYGGAIGGVMPADGTKNAAGAVAVANQNQQKSVAQAKAPAAPSGKKSAKVSVT